MNKLGDISEGHKIGYKSDRYIWAACNECGKERWVRFRHGGYSRLCSKCSMVHNRDPRKKTRLGVMTNDGYIRLHKSLIDPFFYPMLTSQDNVTEHRLVMAKSLGRCLQSFEVVHHINGKHDDNRIENLQLVSDGKHSHYTILENKIRFLEAENIKLKNQIQTLTSCFGRSG